MTARRESPDGRLGEFVQAVIDGVSSLTQEQRAALAAALDSVGSAAVLPGIEQDELRLGDLFREPVSVSKSRREQLTSVSPVSAGSDRTSLTSDKPARSERASAGRTRRKRPVAPIESTLEVQTVSGPAARSLARTQYEAIWEVLQWLHDNPDDTDASAQSESPRI
ncbi:hypothetical protein GCM10023170_017510 [Phytohabitans houttuyneae]|uniref:Uncharacterized protein n=1 Tax=Phytohabitans houttuyneae TaxID=1076126 RepID=A0A6V8KPP1_9ACTN|nr:hypothetical protein Phou_099940 [Phytohabitans houttuyneae]